MHEKLTQIQVTDDGALHQNFDAPAVVPMRDAAVLIPLVQHSEQWQILFIRRAHNERDRHSGQVAFPGGRVEATDKCPRTTALRETHEEIGIDSSQINVIGEIDPYVTVSSYKVTPVVGLLRWPATLSLQAAEVARAFLIPLDWLRNRDNFTYRARQDLDPQSARRYPIIVFEQFDNEVLWGATARMTLNLIRDLESGKILLPTAQCSR